MGMTLTERIESMISRRLRMAHQATAQYERGYESFKCQYRRSEQEVRELKYALSKSEDEKNRLRKYISQLEADLTAANREVYTYSAAWENTLKIMDEMTKTFSGVLHRRNPAEETPPTEGELQFLNSQMNAVRSLFDEPDRPDGTAPD